MSTLKTDAIEAATGTNTDLSLDGKGSGVPDLGAGFKVGGSAGVPTASIQDNAVTLAKMAGLTRGSIIHGDSSGDPAALAVGGANTVLQSNGTDASYGTVATAMIADDAVTLAKLASGTDGELITWDASGDPAAVAVGTATHVLTSNGAGAAPTFQAAGGGGTVLISSINASGAASVDFDSSLSSTYTGYLLVGVGITPATNNAQLWLRVSSDGGSNWDDGASDYSWVSSGQLPGGGTNNAVYDFADTKYTLSARTIDSGLSNSATANSCFTCIISFPSDTTLYTSFQSYCAMHGAVNEFGQRINAGTRVSASAMNSVQVLAESGNITGRFNLYGLANS